jgi:hypothetical protein
MTKRELIKLLEPFNDNDEITIIDDMEGVEAGTPTIAEYKDGVIEIHTEWRE